MYLVLFIMYIFSVVSRERCINNNMWPSVQWNYSPFSFSLFLKEIRERIRREKSVQKVALWDWSCEDLQLCLMNIYLPLNYYAVYLGCLRKIYICFCRPSFVYDLKLFVISIIYNQWWIKRPIHMKKYVIFNFYKIIWSKSPKLWIKKENRL